MNIGIVFATKSIVSKGLKNSDHSFSCTAGETIRRRLQLDDFLALA